MRRSQRVVVKVSVVVLAQEAHNKPASEETHTVTVNVHGAMILLGLQVSIGQLLTLRNSKTSEEVLYRVAYVSPHQSEETGRHRLYEGLPSIVAHFLSSG